MNTNEIVRALRNCGGGPEGMKITHDAADLIESLQAQLEKSEKGRLEGVELYNKYIVLCHEKSKRLHELEAQLAETRLERNAQEANKNYYKAQLAERDRVRQKGATE